MKKKKCKHPEEEIMVKHAGIIALRWYCGLCNKTLDVDEEGNWT